MTDIYHKVTSQPTADPKEKAPAEKKSGGKLLKIIPAISSAFAAFQAIDKLALDNAVKPARSKATIGVIALVSAAIILLTPEESK